MNSALLLDAVVIVAYFAVVMGIGLWMSRGKKSVESFALGGRQIAWWAVLASILAAEISAGTFFGAPGEGFALRNYTYIQLIIGYLLARIVVSAVFIPAYYRHNVVSIYEFLETRFGPRTRRWASAVFLVTRLLASGTRLWVPTVLLVMIWNLSHPDAHATPVREFWLYGGALVFIIFATALYTTAGGIKAVIWTDVIQIVVLLSALGFSLAYLIQHVGGWEGAKPHLLGAQVFDTGLKSGIGFWANVKGVLEQEYTLWAAFLGSTFVTLATHGIDQDMVQRMLTAKNKRQSAVATILSGVADIPIQFAVLGIGILLAVYYGQNPDPLLPRSDTGAIISNKAYPHFILTAMPGGLRGLVLAGVLATTMGSLSTALNALATSYTRDFHFRWFGEPATEAGRVRGLRVGTIIFAVLFVAVALATAWVSAMNPKLRIIPIILGIFGYTYGSLLGVFMVGLFTRGRGNDRGNVIAMLISFLFVVVLSGLHNDVWQLFHPHAWVVSKLVPVWIFGGIEPPLYVPVIQRDVLWLPEWLPTIEFPWRVLFGTLASFAVAVCFRTPAAQIENTRVRNAESGEPHES